MDVLLAATSCAVLARIRSRIVPVSTIAVIGRFPFSKSPSTGHHLLRKCDRPGEYLASPPRIDRFVRSLDPIADRSGDTGRINRRSCVNQRDGPRRTVIAVQYSACDPDVFRDVPTQDRLSGAGIETEVFRLDRVRYRFCPVKVELNHIGRPADADLVEAIMSRYEQHPLRAEHPHH